MTDQAPTARVTLAEARERVGDAVIYGGHCEGLPVPEQGYITSVNDSYVFVRFGGAAHGVACRPDDLLWLSSRRRNPSPEGAV